jgi:flagellar biosynthetic protein FliS
VLSRAADKYQRVYLESACPARLLDELFGRLLRDLGEAKQRILLGDAAGKGAALGHALAILETLQGSLDMLAAPEVCLNLNRLYAYAGRRLLEASSGMDPVALGEVERIVRMLSETFRLAQELDQ